VLVTLNLRACAVAAAPGTGTSHARKSGKDEQKAARSKSAVVLEKSASHTHDTRNGNDEASSTCKKKDTVSEVPKADSGSESDDKVDENLLACYMALGEENEESNFRFKLPQSDFHSGGNS
jgi:hypothetical protein